MRKLIKAVADHRMFCLGVALWSLLLHGMFTVLDPLINKSLIDIGLVEHRVRLFSILAGAVVLVGVAFRLGMLLDVLLVRRLQNALTRSLTMRMLGSYFGAACPEVTGASPGYFIARVYDEPAQVATGVIAVGLGVCVYAASLLGALAVSLYLAWRLTAILLIVVPVLFWIAKKFQPQISQATARESEEEARTRGMVGQVVEAFKTVKLFHLEDSVVARVSRQLNSRLGLGYQTVRTAASFETASGILLSFAEALVLIGAAFEAANGRLSIGGLFGFMSAFWKIINNGTSLIAQLAALARVSAQIDRMLEFESLRRDATEEQRCDHDSVELERVGVAIGEKTILENIDLAVSRGERLLIVGPNGSGKSTLANVITGFVRPTGGAVRRPGRDRIAALLTPFHFIPGTLKDNVNFDGLDGEKQASFLRLAESLDLADKCSVDIGAAFSEGEKKKAQIIMTLMKNADFCLFDEPFANLDVSSKRKAMEIIREETKGKGLVVIMHGDEQFRGHFQRVFRLEGGVEAPGPEAATWEAAR